MEDYYRRVSTKNIVITFLGRHFAEKRKRKGEAEEERSMGRNGREEVLRGISKYSDRINFCKTEIQTSNIVVEVFPSTDTEQIPEMGSMSARQVQGRRASKIFVGWARRGWLERPEAETRSTS